VLRAAPGALRAPPGTETGATGHLSMQSDADTGNGKSTFNAHGTLYRPVGSVLARVMRHIATILFLLCLAVPALAADKVNLNAATRDQLLALGLNQSQAAQIIRYRSENGNFLQVEELLAVPQISRPVFDTVREKVTVDE
jgi:competence protein ComEA